MINFALLPELLTPAREVWLIRRIEAGVIAEHALHHPWSTDATRAELRRLVKEGRRAWEEFLTANLRLAAMMAGQAARRTGMDFDDLLQESAAAMAYALARFDPARGRFSSYACPAIRRHLVRFTSSLDGQLGLPPSRAVTMRRAQGLVQELTQDLARTPELAEISQVLGRDRDWTQTLLRHRPPASLDGLPQQPADPRSPFERSEDDLIGERLRAAVDRLPGDERQVVTLRFGIANGKCHTYGEIAAVLAWSVSSIRRAEQRALAALRRPGLSLLVPDLGRRNSAGITVRA